MASAIVRARIFTEEELATMASSMARIAIVLMAGRLVAENIADILDKRLGPLNVEGS
jgi:hypothetical protein